MIDVAVLFATVGDGASHPTEVHHGSREGKSPGARARVHKADRFRGAV